MRLPVGFSLALGLAASAAAAPPTQLIDLAGKALLPGFIDGHSHLFQCVLMPLQANCSSPPAGPCHSIADIVKQLQAKQEELKPAKGRFIFGYGYDPDLLTEKRHPTKQDLDPAFPDNPVILLHVSGHGAVLNSAALKRYGITAATKTPAGGVIGRLPGSQEPSGLLMETAFIPIFTGLHLPRQKNCLGFSRPVSGPMPPPASPPPRKGQQAPARTNCCKQRRSGACWRLI